MPTAEQGKTATGSTSIAGLLGIAFVVLKLTHVISWSWWWVLAPFWIPFAIAGLITLILTGIVLIRG